MIDHNSIWPYVAVCAAISLACRIIPLSLNINSLKIPYRKFIERLSRYAAAILLTVILVNIISEMSLKSTANAGLILGSGGALFLSIQGVKPYLSFLLGLSTYAVFQLFA
ncbi:AzlD domain-containing protein [Vandammella animalimorsus]|uniref:AzlD domain-containing protein n=1 Tax=Vandammella animalimorsus TaxID=2029117 RepID=UPI001178091A|nr:AzlD domain-containing protein [Vandammella animalimorsus]